MSDFLKRQTLIYKYFAGAGPQLSTPTDKMDLLSSVVTWGSFAVNLIVAKVTGVKRPLDPRPDETAVIWWSGLTPWVHWAHLCYLPRAPLFCSVLNAAWCPTGSVPAAFLCCLPDVVDLSFFLLGFCAFTVVEWAMWSNGCVCLL